MRCILHLLWDFVGFHFILRYVILIIFLLGVNIPLNHFKVGIHSLVFYAKILKRLHFLCNISFDADSQICWFDNRMKIILSII